ncbi:tyrosine-type recombinase/integrase [Bradyrhizobium sp. LeoA1S1]
MAKGLTTYGVEHAKPGAQRREIRDANCRGLYLVVQPAGAKSWCFRYRFNGKPKKLTIGPVYTGKHEPEIVALDHPCTLAGARKLATEADHMVARGIDPAVAKKREKREARQRAAHAEQLDRDTVEAVARIFIERHAQRQTRRTSWLETARLIGLKPDPAGAGKLIRTESGGEVLSQWGDKTIHEITRRDVNELLDRIVSRDSPVTANRCLAAIRKMFSWAVSKDIIQHSPCEGVARPHKETSRDRSLSNDELRLVWRAADVIGGTFGPLTKLLILTAQRRDEVADMKRAELRLQEKSWVIPKERAKNRKEHEVPLSELAMTIIEGLPHIGRAGFLFTTTGETPVSGFSRAKQRLDAEILKLQRADAIAHGEDPDAVEPLAPWTLHDLRRSAATGMARLGIQQQIVERILNHVSGSFAGVTGIYQRYDFLPERRAALAAWASHVQGVVSGEPPATNVVTMRKGA